MAGEAFVGRVGCVASCKGQPAKTCDGRDLSYEGESSTFTSVPCGF